MRKTKPRCSLCDVTGSTWRLASLKIRVCELCLKALTDESSIAGRRLRKAAKATRRYVVLKQKEIDYHKTERVREQNRKARERYLRTPEGRLKEAARAAAYRLVRSGVWVRPKVCPKCRATKDIQFHHTNGYDKANWLVGKWVCRSCHHDLAALDGTDSNRNSHWHSIKSK